MDYSILIKRISPFFLQLRCVWFSLFFYHLKLIKSNNIHLSYAKVRTRLIRRRVLWRLMLVSTIAFVVCVCVWGGGGGGGGGRGTIDINEFSLFSVPCTCCEFLVRRRLPEYVDGGQLCSVHRERKL